MSVKLKYTPNYDKIVNFLYEESDEISNKLIECYQEYIFNIKNKKCKEKIDIVMDEYTNKDFFYKYVQDYFSNNDLYDTYDKIVIKLNKLYKDFEEEKYKNIKTARWL